MALFLGLLLGFTILAYFLFFRKNHISPTNTSPYGTLSECKKYRIHIKNNTNEERIAWMDCNRVTQIEIVHEGMEICTTKIIYYNEEAIEIYQIGYCS